MQFPNVRAVDVGYEFTNGQPTGRLAIRVHVRETARGGFEAVRAVAGGGSTESRSTSSSLTQSCRRLTATFARCH
jgi:hypothetical protein